MSDVRAPTDPRAVLREVQAQLKQDPKNAALVAGGDPVLLSPNSSRRSAPDFDVSASEGAAAARVVAAVPAVPLERGEEPLKVSIWTKRTCIQPLDKHLVR